jgi:hypothetical protein
VGLFENHKLGKAEEDLMQLGKSCGKAYEGYTKLGSEIALYKAKK